MSHLPMTHQFTHPTWPEVCFPPRPRGKQSVAVRMTWGEPDLLPCERRVQDKVPGEDLMLLGNQGREVEAVHDFESPAHGGRWERDDSTPRSCEVDQSLQVRVKRVNDVASDVVDRTRGPRFDLGCSDGGFHEVFHCGELKSISSSIGQRDRKVSGEEVEQEGEDAGSSVSDDHTWADDGAGDGATCHELDGFFCRCLCSRIGIARCERGGLPQRGVVGTSVDGARRHVNEVSHACVLSGFESRPGSFDIDSPVFQFGGSGDRGEGSEVMHDLCALKGFLEGGPVANVRLDEGVGLQRGSGRMLIEPDHGVAAGGESIHESGSDESAGAGDGDPLHGLSFPVPFWSSDWVRIILVIHREPSRFQTRDGCSREDPETGMYILGVSAFYHDSAACLLREGQVIAAAQEERFTRRKNDSAFPLNAIQYCLQEGGIGVEDLEIVAFHEKPIVKFERAMETFQAVAPRGMSTFVRGMPSWFREKLRFADILKSQLGYRGEVLHASHHESHAASAFFLSPHQEAAVITVDGVGEWATNVIGHGQGNRVTLHQELRFPHSLGLLYSAFTQYLGFRVNRGEYKVMGLAPYGEPRHVDTILGQLLDLKPDGSYRLNMQHFAFLKGETMLEESFSSLFGAPVRAFEDPLSSIHLDVARSIQEVVNEVLLRQVRHAHALTGADALCMSGGVALNSVANGRILREGPFQKIWVQPAAHDAGSALGAALVAWHHHAGNPRTSGGMDGMQGALLGPEFDGPACAEALKRRGLEAEELDVAAMDAEVARRIAQGEVVGWFQGRMEFGPRALGSRSILADPRGETVQRRVNERVKFREGFRPFAPAVLAEDASSWFDLPGGTSPYMLFVVPVTAARRIPVDESECTGLDRLHMKRSQVPAVTHVDDSARVQTVTAHAHPRLHSLLQAFKVETGVGMLLNTSFNLRGEPIVCTPDDAVASFLASGLDSLALGPFLLTRPTGAEPTGECPPPPSVEKVPRIMAARFFGTGIAVMALVMNHWTGGWDQSVRCIGFASIAWIAVVFALFLPAWLARLQQGLEKGVRSLLRGVTAVVLVGVYLQVILPMSYFRRFGGRDLLEQKLHPERKSYWSAVRGIGEDHSRMF